MSMTKAEKARMDNLYDRLALRWPSDECPKPMTEDEIKASCVHDGKQSYGGTVKVARGWFVNPYTRLVQAGVSNGMYHGHGDTLRSQGSGQMFFSKVDALLWLKHEKAREFSIVMGEIERRIEEALAEIETELAQCGF